MTSFALPGDFLKPKPLNLSPRSRAHEALHLVAGTSHAITTIAVKLGIPRTRLIALWFKEDDPTPDEIAVFRRLLAIAPEAWTEKPEGKTS